LGVNRFAWYYTKEDLRQLFKGNMFRVIEMENLHNDLVNTYIWHGSRDLR
jgi:hypothetical protein